MVKLTRLRTLSRTFERYAREPLPAHLDTVGYAGQYIFPRELRVLLQDLLDREPGGEQVQQEGDPDEEFASVCPKLSCLKL
ncbi:hypothetical protein BH23ACT11_BH23ACT11_26600 [soil metagenome]